MNVVEWIFFGLCALFTFGGGVATVGSRRPIRSAMGLLATILGICGCYLLLSAEFLAAIQLIVYAGAVVILFIFVVMLLGSAAVSPHDARSAIPRYLGALVFLAAAAGALALIVAAATEGAATLPALPAGFGTTRGMGREIFTTRVVAFELSAALLLVAVIGAMAVARGKQPDPTAPPRGSSARAPGAEAAGHDGEVGA
jgi:NADH-quinone oxidoreductase subunit J